MKVVKINKRIRNRTKEHFLVLLDEYSNANIDYLVEEWCKSEPSGMNYGYTYEWSFVEDYKIMETKNLKTEQAKDNIVKPDVSRSFTIEDLKSAFEQGRIASKSPDSMNIKDFKSWYKERFITGSIDIMGIKTESK